MQTPADLPQQLQRMDRLWHEFRHPQGPPPTYVHPQPHPLGAQPEFDVIIAGGTLGVLVGTVLQHQGWRVAIVEGRALQGRAQEWNISRRELEVLVSLEILTPKQLHRVMATEYNPARVGFYGGPEFWVRDVLNIGVDPAYLLATVKERFLAAGGTLREYTQVERVEPRPDGLGVIAKESAGTITLSGRLLLDMMGHFSPIAHQARWQQQGSLAPAGVCLVVGGCARGLTDTAQRTFSERSSGDLLYTLGSIEHQCQYFWEAFPAREGRTTYLFTYADADPRRPSFSDLWQDYLAQMPAYQGVETSEIDLHRVLMGFFPAYQRSPLPPAWPRILQVGDSSGLQSPLSFGGFGAMLRHLERLTTGLNLALQADCLGQADLALLQPYHPNLSVTWLFQKSMSVGVDRVLDPQHINRLLSTTFQSMADLGDGVLLPFLQDVVQFPALTKTMAAMALADPLLVGRVIGQVGIGSLLDWCRHYGALGGYHLLARPPAPTTDYRQFCRWAARHYGSGADYHLPATLP